MNENFKNRARADIEVNSIIIEQLDREARETDDIDRYCDLVDQSIDLKQNVAVRRAKLEQPDSVEHIGRLRACLGRLASRLSN